MNSRPISKKDIRVVFKLKEFGMKPMAISKLYNLNIEHVNAILDGFYGPPKERLLSEKER